MFTRGSLGFFVRSSSPFLFLFQNPSQTAPIETAVVLTCLLVAARKRQAFSNCTHAMESKGSMNRKRQPKKNEKRAHAQSTSGGTGTEFQKNMF